MVVQIHSWFLDLLPLLLRCFILLNDANERGRKISQIPWGEKVHQFPFFVEFPMFSGNYQKVSIEFSLGHGKFGRAWKICSHAPLP